MTNELPTSNQLLEEHHRRHMDFAKLLVLVSTAFLTIATSSEAVEPHTGAMKFVLFVQFLSMLCGCTFLYMLIREPLLFLESKQAAVQGHDGKATMGLFRKICLSLHIGQVLCFGVSFATLVGSLLLS